MSAKIEIESLYFEFVGKRALENISLSIEPSKITAMVGPNGAGKTTLLRCMAALEMPFSGVVRINGIDTRRDPHGCHPFLGYLTDSFGLYDELSVERCLSHAAEIRELRGAAKSQAISKVVETLDLKNLLTQDAGTLSRGQRQRVAIAQTIVHEPPILLLDEPASGLDPEARIELSKLLCNLRDRGVTIVVSSHILAELEDYSDHMLTIRQGKVMGYVPLHTSKSKGIALKIQAIGDLQPIVATLKELASISGVIEENKSVCFTFSGTEHEQSLLLKMLLERGHLITSFSEERRTMQSVYFEQVTSGARA